ncbi:MAG: hypothetical protein IRZ11_01545 [Clostridia bacterium]|nr:hypothetical protein [Clostridia bacterium]
MEACRAVEPHEAPEHVRRAARGKAGEEGLHALADGFWLLAGPLERSAGHRFRLVAAELVPGGAGGARAVRAVVEHERPASGTPTAQVLTRPTLLLATAPGLRLEVVLREPDGSERSYRAV